MNAIRIGFAGVMIGGAAALLLPQTAAAQFASSSPAFILAQVDEETTPVTEVPTMEDPVTEDPMTEEPMTEEPMEVPEMETPTTEVPEAEVLETEMLETEVPETEVLATGTIVDVAASIGSFDTLLQAVEAAGLTEALSAEGPFTVFAPTDDAFAALPEGAVAALLLPENQGVLADILTYHVISGEVPAAAASTGMVPTLSEDALSIEVGETITVDNATVIQADVPASNGIIHAIDAVLIPASALAELQARP